MIDLGILDNIKKLKARFMGEDYEQSELAVIEAWEKRVKELSDKEDFSHLETTQEIAKELKGRIKGYYLKRATTTKPEELLTLDAKIGEDKWLAKLLCANPQVEIEEINRLVLEELSE